MYPSSLRAESKAPEKLGLDPKHWKVNPRTGIISLTDEAFKRLCNSDPIEKWYTIDQEPIARGQFAAVHRCIHRISEEEFAAKFSSKIRLGSECSADLIHEVAVCALMKDATKVVGLVDVFNTPTELILVMEYAPGGDLQTLLDEDLVPYERNVICFLRQLLEGLVFIHDKNIVHLDIKPQNLVLMGDFPDCCVKLCDFEISRLLTPGYEVREILGTADYVAPEIIHYEPITTKTDMWSFGVLTYVLLTGFLPFGGENDQETFLEITRGELDFPEELFEDISEHAIDFIKKLLIRQPHLRMSAKECLEHPWMQADLKMPKIAPVLCLNTNATSSTPQETNLNANHQQNPFLKHQLPQQVNNNSNRNSPVSTLHPSIPTPPNLNEMDLTYTFQKAFEILESGNYTSPRATTPINITPNILSPINSPRHQGLPPLHPYMNSRGCPSTHSSTSSLNKGNSRQSLERLRSISKSREILVERLQNSSQRKALSRSRERLFDGRYGLNKSSTGLFEHRSFSHSVEMLPPNDWYAFDESLCNSYNSVNLLPIFNVLPIVHPNNNINNRHYKNTPLIDRRKENILDNNRGLTNNNNYSESRKLEEETDYDKIISNYKSKVNVAYSKRRKSNPYIEHKNHEKIQMEENEKENGKESERKQIESLVNNNIVQNSHLDNKNNNVNTKNERENSSHYNFKENEIKSEKYDKSKRETPKRRKEKDKNKRLSTSSLQKEFDEKNDQNSCSAKSSQRNNGRGSISHIEQRIQVRHERLIEKQENSKKNKRKSQNPKAANNSNQSNDETKSSKETRDKKGKNISQMKPKTKTKCDNIIKSSCSSLESIKENSKNDSNISNSNCNNSNEGNNKNSKKSNKNNVISSKNDKKTRKTRGDVKQPDTKIIVVVDKVNKKNNFSKKNSKSQIQINCDKNLQNKKISETSKLNDKISCFDDAVDDGIFSRSNSMDSSTSVDSTSTIKADETPTEILHCVLKDIKMSSRVNEKVEIKPNELNKLEKCKETKTQIPKTDNSNKTTKKQTLQQSGGNKSSSSVKENKKGQTECLTIIKEEEENSQNNKKTNTLDKKKKQTSVDRKFGVNGPKPPHFSTHFDNTNRSKSFSMQNRVSLSHLRLSRSNSIHLDTPISGKPRPWGQVCNGAVNRACKMFSEKSVDIALVPRKTSDPTHDRP
ncbi:UNVERIFIED_CONTAM: hypothetical protein RMT77_003230 [Armadillidium vulgare]